MSSPSPSQSPLANKAPEQLKVTELRDELRKRGLTPKGLKKDLVERLEEALRVEDAQRKAVEAIAAPAPVVQEQVVTETLVVESDVTVVQETLFEQPKGEFVDALPEAGKGGLFAEEDPLSGPDAQPETERPVVAETEMFRPAEAVIEESRLAETTSVNKPAETVIEDGPAETATSVDKPVETVTEEKRGGDSASVDMSAEVTMEPESAVTTTDAVMKESIETTVEERVVVETVTEVRTSEGEVTRMEETMVVESVEVMQEVRDVKVEVPKEDPMQLQGASEDKKAFPDINSTPLQKQESQESLAIDVGDKEGQEVPNEEAPKDEVKRQENGEDGTMDIDSEAQAGMKRKEHEVPAPDQTKRLRKWNSGKDETKSADNMTPGVNAGLAGSNPVGSRSVVDRISKPVVSNTKSDASNNGRIVPESTKIPTNSLRIDRFVRPFTLKALKDLLAETGSFSDFWIDHIKTHCYVTYSSVEEAVATRNALYNLRWPAVGGKELIADFVEPEEVKQKCESGNDKPAAGAAGGANMTVAVPRAGSERSSLASPNTPVSPFPRPVKEKPQKKESEPIVTLDDLFKKTVAKPNIYYLPLTDAQVAEKRAAKT